MRRHGGSVHRAHRVRRVVSGTMLVRVARMGLLVISLPGMRIILVWVGHILWFTARRTCVSGAGLLE